MHKVDELEKRWYRYKLKKISYPIVGTLLVAGTITAGVNIGIYLDENRVEDLITSTSTESTKVLAVSKVNNTPKQEIVTKIKEPIKVEKEQLQDVFLEPTIPIVNMERESKVQRKKISSSSKNHSKRLVKAKPNSYLTDRELSAMRTINRVEEEIPHVPKKIHFQTNSVNYIATMKRKFAQSNSPLDALLLAKAFYKKGDYKESESWSLSANKLDSSLQESWFLFAKSKAKLGKKREALKILVTYYKKHHSLKARELIKDIKGDKI